MSNQHTFGYIYIYDIWYILYIYDIWYMIYDILWYMIYDILWYMIYDIYMYIWLWYMIYDIWCMIYDIRYMIYDIWDMRYDTWYMIYDISYIYIYIKTIFKIQGTRLRWYILWYISRKAQMSPRDPAKKVPLRLRGQKERVVLKPMPYDISYIYIYSDY